MSCRCYQGILYGIWGRCSGTTCSGTSHEEIKLKLAAAGKELDKYHKKLEKGEVYLTAEEIDAIISRIIRETAS